MDSETNGKKPFAVVWFLEDNLCSEVPVIWLTNDEKECWWPNASKKAKTYMLQNVAPNQLTWTKYAVKVECFTNNLQKARQKAENQNYVSTEEESLGRGKRKTKKQYSSSSSEANLESDSSEEGETSTVPKRELALLNKKSTTHHKTNSYKDVKENFLNVPAVQQEAIASNLEIFEKAPIIFEYSLEEGTQVTEDNNNQVNFQVTPKLIKNQKTTLDQIKDICESIYLLAKNIDSRLEKFELKEANVSTTILSDNPMECHIMSELPIKNLAQLQEFEILLEDENMLATFKKFMMNIGGRNPKDNIVRCLKSLYSNEMATSCSWLGYRNNFRMCDLRSINVIKMVIMQSFKDIKLNEFENITSEWLRLSKLRLIRQQQNRQKI